MLTIVMVMAPENAEEGEDSQCHHRNPYDGECYDEINGFFVQSAHQHICTLRCTVPHTLMVMMLTMVLMLSDVMVMVIVVVVDDVPCWQWMVMVVMVR